MSNWAWLALIAYLASYGLTAALWLGILEVSERRNAARFRRAMKRTGHAPGSLDVTSIDFPERGGSMPQSRVHYAGEVTVCDRCGEPIIFLVNNNTAKLAPITIASYPDGNIRELQPNNQYQALGPANAVIAKKAGELLRRNHFMDCPNAAQFARSNKR